MKRQLFVSCLTAIASGLVCASSVNAAEWAVAAGMGSVSFSAVQQGTRFTGRFESFTAAIDIDPAHVEHGSIVGTVETSSVNTRDHDRDASLSDPDWFDSANYAEARFESTSITKDADGSYRANGELTIKGKTNPVTMSFTFDATGDTAKFKGTFSIDRFAFNVGEGWSDTSWVGQNVDVTVDLSLAK